MAIIFVDSTASGDNNGTSWTHAYTSLHTALQNAALDPSDQVLASGTFAETVTLDANVVTSITTAVLVQGDDKSGGAGRGNPAQFTITGGSARANCVVAGVQSWYYAFEDMRCTAATGDGFGSIGGNRLVFRRCRFDTNGGFGCRANINCLFEECQFDGNTGGAGLLCDFGSWAIGCLSFNNNTWGFQGTGGAMEHFVNCTGYNNPSGFIVTGNPEPVIIGCTADGETVGVGLSFTGSTLNPIAFNNILHDFATGISAGQDVGRLAMSRNNLINSSSANDYVNFATFSGEIIDPGTLGFVDEGGDDYRLASDSAAKAAGTDAGDVVNGVSYKDMGAHQREEAGGGGGGGNMQGGLQ